MGWLLAGNNQGYLTPSLFTVTDAADAAGSAADVTLRYAITTAVNAGNQSAHARRGSLGLDSSTRQRGMGFKTLAGASGKQVVAQGCVASADWSEAVRRDDGHGGTGRLRMLQMAKGRKTQFSAPTQRSKSSNSACVYSFPNLST